MSNDNAKWTQTAYKRAFVNQRMDVDSALLVYEAVSLGKSFPMF
jgi:ABC-type cobalamin/Fe3+-siderophores transport system ATPase subunit